MQADPDLQVWIAEDRHAPNHLDGGMAGKRRMIVVGDRSPEYCRDPVSHFTADDSAELTHRGAHRRQRRLEARYRFLGVEFRHEVGRSHDIRTQDRYELSFADGILAHRAPRRAAGVRMRLPAGHSGLSLDTSLGASIVLDRACRDKKANGE